ncbi:MAG: hypothetical protein JRJ13_13385 [Deltaproteobacteria bacterium]|nr:hypothetical protein [Deltaproteobacteria bacterium]
MLILDKKHFIIGFIMLIVFVIILIIMSTPVFKGKNAFQAADNLFNSIAKASSYKMPQLEKQAHGFKGTAVNWAMDRESIFLPDLTKRLLVTAGAQVSLDEGNFRVKGDLGKITAAALKDAEIMYFDREKDISIKYSAPGKKVLFSWWRVLKQVKEILKRQKKVKEASFVDDVVKKGIEVGYNFYGIASEKASKKAGTLAFSLVFYVFYTVWWGFSIFFLFEGFGLVMEAGEKEEI